MTDTHTRMFRSIGTNTFELREDILIPEAERPLLLCDDVPPTLMTRDEFFAQHPQYAYTWDRDRHIKGNGTDGIDDGLCVCRECRELSHKI